MLKDIIEEIERHQRLLADENEESVKEMEEFQQTLPLMQDASFEKLKKRHIDNMAKVQELLSNIIIKATK